MIVPVTRSELLFFTAGVAAGAFGHAAFPKIKEKLGPLMSVALAGVGDAMGDKYADVVRTISERVEAVQDALAEMKANQSNAEAAAPSADAGMSNTESAAGSQTAAAASPA
jgi:hypothetical protein